MDDLNQQEVLPDDDVEQLCVIVTECQQKIEQYEAVILDYDTQVQQLQLENKDLHAIIRNKEEREGREQEEVSDDVEVIECLKDELQVLIEAEEAYKQREQDLHSIVAELSLQLQFSNDQNALMIMKLDKANTKITRLKTTLARCDLESSLLDNSIIEEDSAGGDATATTGATGATGVDASVSSAAVGISLGEVECAELDESAIAQESDEEERGSDIGMAIGERESDSRGLDLELPVMMDEGGTIVAVAQAVAANNRPPASDATTTTFTNNSSSSSSSSRSIVKSNTNDACVGSALSPQATPVGSPAVTPVRSLLRSLSGSRVASVTPLGPDIDIDIGTADNGLSRSRTFGAKPASVTPNANANANVSGVSQHQLILEDYHSPYSPVGSPAKDKRSVHPGTLAQTTPPQWEALLGGRPDTCDTTGTGTGTGTGIKAESAHGNPPLPPVTLPAPRRPSVGTNGRPSFGSGSKSNSGRSRLSQDESDYSLLEDDQRVTPLLPPTFPPPKKNSFFEPSTDSSDEVVPFMED